MKALVYQGIGEMEYTDIPMADGDILIKVCGCGICGTDMKTFLNGHHLFKPPTVLGHEFFGTVEKCPQGSKLKIGDMVAVAPYYECGSCSMCKAGLGQMCHNKKYVPSGAFCEYVAVDKDYEDGIFLIPNEIEYDMKKAFALAEPLACVLNGIEHLALSSRSNVLIVGGGPMGMLFSYSLDQKGYPVTIVEPNDERRGFLIEKGFKAVKPGDLNASDYDNIVVAVNNADLVSEYVRKVADGGRVLVFSGLKKGTDLSLDSYSIHYREVSMTGTCGFALKHYQEAFELIKIDPARYRSLISHEFSLSQGLEAFNFLRSGKGLKILITP